MSITISPELEANMRERATAQGLSVDAFVERVILAELDPGHEQPLDRADPEFEEIQSVVLEGLTQLDRGEGRPAREVFAERRARHALSR